MDPCLEVQIPPSTKSKDLPDYALVQLMMAEITRRIHGVRKSQEVPTGRERKLNGLVNTQERVEHWTRGERLDGLSKLGSIPEYLGLKQAHALETYVKLRNWLKRDDNSMLFPLAAAKQVVMQGISSLHSPLPMTPIYQLRDAIGAATSRGHGD